MTPINDNTREPTERDIREIFNWMNTIDYMLIRVIPRPANDRRLRLRPAPVKYQCAVVNGRTFWPACSFVSPMAL